MSEKITIYLSEPIRKIKSEETHQFALQEFYRYMYPYIPFRTGTLADNVSFENDGIHFNQIYAHRLYQGKDFNFYKELHPLAQAEWGKVAGDIHGEAIAKAIKNFAMR